MIGFLATGNEIVEGDILNTNGQIIAQALVEHGLTVGTHVTTSDREHEIEAGFQFLLAHYDVVITIGGLGPTSDDRTRFVMGKVLNKELVFDETSWQVLVQRFAQRHIQLTKELEKVNRQQALFPEGATILPNKNGSAAGCVVEYNNKKIFMLPGPPQECLPMFMEYVLPVLTKTVRHKITKLRWLLLGVIESEIAALIDQAVKNDSVTTGYRVMRPYLEIKIYANADVDLSMLKQKVEKIIAPYMVEATEQAADELLKNKIKHHARVLTDQVLKVDGFLNHQLDTQLLMEMGKEFARYFSAKQKITKVITVETSGIAIALTTAMILNVPVIFARKQKSLLTDADNYTAEVFSFTKQTMNHITVAKKLLTQEDSVIIIDDFLAHGQAALGLVSIVKQAGATLVGVGAVIEKVFQEGGNKLRESGLDVYALARIKKLIPPNQVEYA